MSHGEYNQYSGNPYGHAEGGYGGSNPYGGTPSAGFGASDPYGGTPAQGLGPPPPLSQQTSNYSQPSQHSTPGAPPLEHGREPLSDQAFLERIQGVKRDINQLSSNIGSIATIHQRLLSSPDNSASNQLEAIVTNTQIQNSSIKDQIKFLEKDLSRTPDNSVKRSQITQLKNNFRKQLEDFEREERDYRGRYRDAIARQYRIVNPDATQEEVNEAANADWGDEGIFQTALKSNRSGHASSVLGAVRARHNDILRIERTLEDLALLFNQLNEQVVFQDPHVTKVEEAATQVKTDTNGANEHLLKSIEAAKRRKKLKWWTLGVVVAIIAVLALVLGLYFGLPNSRGNRNNSNNSNNPQ